MDDRKQTKDLFKRFIGEMNDIFSSEEYQSRVEDQEDLLDKLFELEKGFRDTLLKVPEGKAMYKDFMVFITDDKKNILSTRVYFREKQETFSDRISNAFVKGKPHLLYNFRINYRFAKWVMDRYQKSDPHYRKLNNYFKKIIEVRKTLCEQNLPLAINRAKIFWSKAPSFHIEYMDLIQSSAEGLMTALDKFVPPYRTVFRSVAISRMTLNMSENSNQSLIRFSPKERRILYRANMAKKKEKLHKDEDVLEFVQQSFEGVTHENLGEIMVAASNVLSMENSDSLSSDLFKSCIMGADNQIIHQQMVGKISQILETLTVFERKILLLKFGKISEDGLDTGL